MEGGIGAKGGREQQHSHSFSSEHALVSLLPPLPRRLSQQYLHVRLSTHKTILMYRHTHTDYKNNNNRPRLLKKEMIRDASNYLMRLRQMFTQLHSLIRSPKPLGIQHSNDLICQATCIRENNTRAYSICYRNVGAYNKYIHTVISISMLALRLCSNAPLYLCVNYQTIIISCSLRSK